MIFPRKPVNFHPKFDVVSCFLDKEDKFLLLKRSPNKPQGSTWAMPAGKVEKDAKAGPVKANLFRHA